MSANNDTPPSLILTRGPNDGPKPDPLSLVLKALCCKHWRAVNGMLDLRGARVNVPNLDEFTVVIFTPNFDDKQTVDLLRGLVQKAWGKPDLQETFDAAESQYKVSLGDLPEEHVVCGRTDAEALLEALEAANSKEMP
jgi:hypothetical protein